MSLQVIDTESGTGLLKISQQKPRQINHKHRQVSGIVNRTLLDIHKVFQAPELFGVPKIELELEPEAVILNQWLIAYSRSVLNKMR